jgi:hypothetical protein
MTRLVIALIIATVIVVLLFGAFATGNDSTVVFRVHDTQGRVALIKPMLPTILAVFVEKGKLTRGDTIICHQDYHQETQELWLKCSATGSDAQLRFGGIFFNQQ